MSDSEYDIMRYMADHLNCVCRGQFIGKKKSDPRCDKHVLLDLAAMFERRDADAFRRQEELVLEGDALRAENERLRDIAEDVKKWAEAYPEDIFPKPTPEQVDEVCKALGFRLDRIAAMVLREFTKPWGDKARKALAEGKGDAT